MITGIVLAAGTSSRLGRPKHLLDLGGKPVICHVVDAALASTLDEVVVVLGHAGKEVRGVLRSDPRLCFVENPSFADGQSTSLIAGLRAAAADTEAIVVLLGDQPSVSSGAIDAVVERYARDPVTIVQASYSGTPAHPTLIGRALLGELTKLTGDEGARSIVQRHRRARALVEIGGAPPADIDTESDYREALARYRPAL